MRDNKYRSVIDEIIKRAAHLILYLFIFYVLPFLFKGAILVFYLLINFCKNEPILALIGGGIFFIWLIMQDNPKNS